MTTKKFSKLIALCLGFIVALSFMVVGNLKTKTNTVNAEEVSHTETIYYGNHYGNSDYSCTNVVEEITYASCVETNDFLSGSFPANFKNDYDITNACTPVAASNIVNFYDRWYDNLIENCIAGAMLNTGIYYYFPMAYQTATKDQLIRDLYNLMGTNTEHAGTSKAQYNNGFTTYVQNQGYNISYTNCETNGTFNFETYKNMITQGKPVALFLIGYNLTEIGTNEDENLVVFSKNEYVTNHVVVGYGYRHYKFYDENNNLISEKIALAVSCGLEIGNCYYILNNNGTLEDAEAVYIY